MKQDSDGGRGRQHGGTRGTKVRRLREDELALGEICQEDGREYKEGGDNNKNSPGMPQRYPTLWVLIYSFNLKKYFQYFVFQVPVPAFFFTSQPMVSPPFFDPGAQK